MNTCTSQDTGSFSHAHLPMIDKPVFRMGIAGNYGIDSSDILWAADQGANYWVWGYSYNKVTQGIREVIRKNREKHVVAMLGWGLAGWQVKYSVEQALRKLGTDYIDVFKLGWMGRTSVHSQGVMETLVKLRDQGKIKAIGTSIHDRKRAGLLARNSEIDLFMIRYNAKHPGAEQDIFPHLGHRHPGIVSYTALAWGQLLKPLKTGTMQPWPGHRTTAIPPLTPELCYRFVLTNTDVHLVLTGPADREQLRQNLNAVSQGPLNDRENEWIREFGRRIRSQKRYDYV